MHVHVVYERRIELPVPRAFCAVRSSVPRAITGKAVLSLHNAIQRVLAGQRTYRFTRRRYMELTANTCMPRYVLQPRTVTAKHLL